MSLCDIGRSEFFEMSVLIILTTVMQLTSVIQLQECAYATCFGLNVVSPQYISICNIKFDDTSVSLFVIVYLYILS